MMSDSISKLAQKFNNCRFHEEMASHTTMKAGGQAELFALPKDSREFMDLLEDCRTSGTRYFILGGGSNVIFSDGEFKGCVISTERLNSIQIAETTEESAWIKCGCGTPTSELIDFCSERCYSGLEEFAGLPGTVGGNTYMNARCYAKDFSEILQTVEYIDAEGNIRIYEKKSNDWDYKLSPFMRNNGIILSVVFRLKVCKTSEKDEILSKCKKYISDRREKGHFKAPSSGSVFKNDRSFGSPSGKLIDEAGLKGTKMGGAQIAPWHGNFIINSDNASASDIKRLVELVQDKVKERTGFLLEPEIIFVE